MTDGVPAAERMDLPDQWEEIDDVFYDQGYGDGLPIVPPTEARVGRFLGHLGRDPQEVVAVLPPSMGVATVEKVVVNAVMAGCRPQHLPVVLAAVQACAEPHFNARSIQVTSNPAGVLVLVNGPVRDEAGIASGANCMGHGTRANLTIGRAVRLTLSNIGTSAIGVVDKACHGFPGKISFCFGENEDDSPWDPLHVERGFDRDDSTVTVVPAQGTSNILIHGRPTAEDILMTIAHGMINSGVNNFTQGAGEPLLVMNPQHAHALASEGVGKAELRTYVFERARVPLEWYPERAREVSSMRDRAVDGAIPITDRPERIMVVVAGIAGSHSTFIPTFADASAVTTPVRTGLATVAAGADGG